MKEPAIVISGLGKRYNVGSRHEPYGRLTESISNFFTLPFRKRTQRVSRSQPFWALSDVSFSVMPGEVVGLIGSNGAGKSTLLKTINRVTSPTLGEISIRGRVGSLLEVGTGFHPELSGRENIYLNGVILGMSKASISKKFDQIVEFSEVAKFIDTPVKRYSSGMYVRLAFSVAVHLETEILLVDEVLAVGDIAFQQKCLSKIESIAKAGRTIIFVSHNLDTVRRLCKRGIVLRAGKKICDSDISTSIAHYAADSHPKHFSYRNISEEENGDIQFLSVSFSDSKGSKTSVLQSGCPFSATLKISCSCEVHLSRSSIGFAVNSQYSQPFFRCDSGYCDITTVLRPGIHSLTFHVHNLPLNSGRYPITFFSKHSGTVTNWLEGAAEFTILTDGSFSSGIPATEGQKSLLTIGQDLEITTEE